MSCGSNNSMGLEIPVLLSSECWVLYRKLKLNENKMLNKIFVT